jgi:hypothetical protein
MVGWMQAGESFGCTMASIVGSQQGTLRTLPSMASQRMAENKNMSRELEPMLSAH